MICQNFPIYRSIVLQVFHYYPPRFVTRLHPLQSNSWPSFGLVLINFSIFALVNRNGRAECSTRDETEQLTLNARLKSIVIQRTRSFHRSSFLTLLLRPRRKFLFAFVCLAFFWPPSAKSTLVSRETKRIPLDESLDHACFFFPSLAGKKQTSLPSLEAVRFDLGVDLVTASSLSFLSLRGKKASEFFLPSLINKIRGKIIVVPLSTMVKINFALNRLNACRLISLAY